ncbi:MAG: hypothetical protein ACK48Y_14565, partial [Planctomyces sp.]
MKVTGLSTGLQVEGQRVARGIWFSVFGFQFGGAVRGFASGIAVPVFVGGLRGGGGQGKGAGQYGEGE